MSQFPQSQATLETLEGTSAAGAAGAAGLPSRGRSGRGKRALTVITNERILNAVSIGLYLLVWYLLTSGLHVIRPLFFPSPHEVVSAAYRLRFTIFDHIGSTLMRVVAGLGLGVVLGVGAGLAMSANRIVRGLLDPQIESLRPVPPIAAIPFFILWFGIAERGKIILNTLGVFMILVVITVEAVRNVPLIHIDAARTLGASGRDVYRTVIIPAIIPTLIAGVRIAAAAAFALDIAAEFMGAQQGLGFLILNARETLDTNVILFVIVVIGILSSLLDRTIRYVGNYVTRWSERGGRR